MFLKTGTERYTRDYWGSLQEIRGFLLSADKVIVGVGSGLSASGGLNYMNPELVQKWFPEYYELGFKSLVELQSAYWWFENSNPLKYWGYWARHIYHIRYESGVLQPYWHLKELLREKDYFICSTNVDGQLIKAGIQKEKIFAPQGDYCYFQCFRPCCSEVFYNEDMVRKMVQNMPDKFEIRQEDIPLCPNCGGNLVPNLRCDHSFVEAPHIQNIKDYESFGAKASQEKSLLLELGVGYNTPGIIRYPFERFAGNFKDTKLVRINLDRPNIPEELEERAFCIRKDIGQVLADLLKA